MEPETTNEVNTADDFWTQIESVLATECKTHDNIDDSLRSYIGLIQTYRDEYITTEDHLGHCVYLLYVSPLFTHHTAYIRQQLIYCLLQENDTNTLRIAVAFLLAHAREDESTFDLLNKEGTFLRLVELVAHPEENEESMHRALMELMYEMARIQKITNHDLACIDDDFVRGLFDIIEQVSNDVNDPYHYPVIRVLLVLNEQFMVAAHDPAVLSQKSMPLTNKVVKVLSSHGSRYKTFGANIILLLNREDETSLQLLTLKLMYLLFTTPPTYEYFYTNDLRVLVDILIRNLLDLPEHAAALRHTYLRVLYPLLEHTQLQYPPYYKRQEICKLLALLCGDQAENEDGSSTIGAGWNHFEDVDETTTRLVRRCQMVSWLSDPEVNEMTQVESPTGDKSPEAGSPTSPTKPRPPQLPAPRKLRKRDSSKASYLSVDKFLTPQLEAARQSSVSMAEMAQHKEKPGVITPSRNPSVKHGLREAIFAKKEKPPPPKARRSGFMRPKVQPASTELEVTRLGVPEKTHTPLEERNEAERYDDEAEAIGAETCASKKQSDASEKRDETMGTTLEVQAMVQPKKPPPAPKARRGWRMRKSKDHSSEDEPRREEPGKFSTSMPSVSTSTEHNPFSPPTERAPGDSPFSLAKEKTLDPLQDSNALMSPGDTPKRSVSEAMSQAQAQATNQVQECLENPYVSESNASQPPPVPAHPSRPSSLQQPQNIHNQFEQDSPSTRRTVLAPPGQAPIRAVPGPRVDVEASPELERGESPFLVDDERSRSESEAHLAAVTPTTGRTSRRESWEDFEDDEHD